MMSGAMADGTMDASMMPDTDYAKYDRPEKSGKEGQKPGQGKGQGEGKEGKIPGEEKGQGEGKEGQAAGSDASQKGDGSSGSK
jgi:hypothetical protein